MTHLRGQADEVIYRSQSHSTICEDSVFQLGYSGGDVRCFIIVQHFLVRLPGMRKSYFSFCQLLPPILNTLVRLSAVFHMRPVSRYKGDYIQENKSRSANPKETIYEDSREKHLSDGIDKGFGI